MGVFLRGQRTKVYIQISSEKHFQIFNHTDRLEGKNTMQGPAMKGMNLRHSAWQKSS